MDSEVKSAALSKPCVLIIVVAGVERFVYKGVASNIVTFLTDVVKMSTSSAAKSVSTWNGVTSMLPLASAILADSFWDRYSTITVSSLLYIVGLVGLTSWTVLHSWMPSSLLFLPLYLISVGQGGYNPSLQAFGADQLLCEDGMESLPAEQKNQVKGLFFQWWYFGICSGSLLGNSIMSYIQDTFGWGLGFAIPCGVMVLSVVAFCCGTPLYTCNEQNTGNRPSDSIFRVLKEIVTCLITRKVRLPTRDDDRDISELELEEKALKDEFTDLREAEDGHDTAPDVSVTKAILRLLPIWTTLLIFAVIFEQPMTFFTEQGILMNHKVGSTFVIPPAMLQSSTTMSVILLMPLYDKIFVPLMRVFTREEKGVTVLQRIGIGMVLSVAAMVTASTVESKRLRFVSEGDGATHQLSIFWLLPQYILLGVADVFTVVGMQEFFYTQVPSTMRTIGIALYLSVFGFGNSLGAFLIAVLETTTATTGEGHGWFSDDPRQERLDKYYWFLAFLGTVSFMFFTYLCKYYNEPEAPRR